MKYFLEDVPSYLEKLTPESTPEWGEMNASEMMRHLRLGLKGSLSITDGELTTPEEKLPRAKAFLMSDRAFPKAAPMPFFYHTKPSAKDFSENKEALLNALKEFVDGTEDAPDFISFHPSFGHLNAEETRHLHFKHIRHHFQQFGVFPEPRED
ncbi:MAG: hypothetical protein SchgKO_18940 [Schleiferiaceae bacterium]